MRIAVLGLGFMGATHARAMTGLAGLELAAVYSGDERKLSGDLSGVRGNLGSPAARLDFTGVKKYRDVEDVFKDRSIDAVDICLPTHLHDFVALDALRAGKHVLVEKPIALDGFSADRMLNAARRYGRLLMTAHVIRFWPEYVALREAVKGKTLRYAVLRRSCATPVWSEWLGDPAQSGGGAFDLLIHDVDFALHLWGKPQSVSAGGICADGVDCLSAHLFYPDGAVVEIEGGWRGAGDIPFAMEYSVALDNATVEFNSINRPPTVYSREGGAEPLRILPDDPYTTEIAYFAECCRFGWNPDLCPPADSAAAVKLARLLLDSRARRGARLACSI